MDVFDPRKEVQLRIENCDRQALRLRLDAIRLRSEFTEKLRAKDNTCGEILSFDVESRVIQRCVAPAQYFYLPGDAESLCQTHFEEAPPEVKQYVPPTKLVPCSQIHGVLLIRAEFKTSDMIDLLKKFILFRVVNDGNCKLVLTRAEKFNGVGVLSAEPEIKFFDRIFYVEASDVVSDEDAEISGWPLTLSEWVDQVLKAGLLDDDDLAWAEQAAQWAFGYFRQRIYDGFDAIAWRVCHEAAYHAIDQALSESELRGLDKAWDNELLWYLRDLRLKAGNRENANYDLGRLREYQKELSFIWVSVKRDAYDAQNHPLWRKHWRERVKASYDVSLPDDLVEWLNKSDDRQNRLMEFGHIAMLQKRLCEGYELSKPSEIALEHAARFCGAPPYSYAISTLWEIYREQKDAMENSEN